MRRMKKLISVLGAAVCALCLCISPVYADTDGTEMQVMETSRMEIQLGTEWSGVEFQLRTDVGMYPDSIIVGEDGVLRLEIGGSSVYVLTCLNSDMAVPQNSDVVSTQNEPAENPELSGSVAEDTSQNEQQESADAATPDDTTPIGSSAEGETPETEDSSSAENPEDESTVAGIPVMHIVLFGGGLVLAVGGLIAMRILSKRREDTDEYDYDDEEDC